MRIFRGADRILFRRKGVSQALLETCSQAVWRRNGRLFLLSNSMRKETTVSMTTPPPEGPWRSIRRAGVFLCTGLGPFLQLQVYSGTIVRASNTGWGGDAQIAATESSVGAFDWTSGMSNDSALLITLPPGSYTAQVSGASGDTGVALAEVYEVP
jgi:hypothetical protein